MHKLQSAHLISLDHGHTHVRSHTHFTTTMTNNNNNNNINEEDTNINNNNEEEEDNITLQPPSTPTTSTPATPNNKAHAQIQKLKDANNKYKQLLKLARERIETQQEELRQVQLEQQQSAAGTSTSSNINNNNNNSHGNQEENGVIIRVIHCTCEEDPQEDAVIGEGDSKVIWALFEYETAPPADDLVVDTSVIYKRWKKWMAFDNETELADFVRRDAAAGEPLVIPPFSISVRESEAIQNEARQAVAHVTEEFRRYRVRAEVARKQADAALKAARIENVDHAQKRIVKNHNDNNTRDNSQHEDDDTIKRLKSALLEQDLRWKEAYDVIEQENRLLKEGGPKAEATLASQWRRRFEECLKEKDDLTAKMEMMTTAKTNSSDSNGGNDYAKLESKYRSLKDEYKLYRRKAKEIFDSQQHQQMNSNGRRRSSVNHHYVDENNGIGSDGSLSEDPRIPYLRSLMIQYFTSKDELKEPMENAIFTVLKFSSKDRDKIKERREAIDYANSYWGYTSSLLQSP